MRMFLYLLISLVVAFAAYVRLAPSDPSRWHISIPNEDNIDLAGRAVRIVPNSPDVFERLIKLIFKLIPEIKVFSLICQSSKCIKNYKKFFKQVEKLLSNNGISLIHTIGSVNPPRDPHPWVTKYIFPGGYTPSLSEVTTPIEKAGLVVSDIEVLKLHYSHTLRHWKENCIKNKEKIIKMYDARFFRMWEFYLTGCEIAFKWGDQVVYQFQLTKSYTSTPITRDYIYH